MVNAIAATTTAASITAGTPRWSATPTMTRPGSGESGRKNARVSTVEIYHSLGAQNPKPRNFRPEGFRCLDYVRAERLAQRDSRNRIRRAPVRTLRPVEVGGVDIEPHDWRRRFDHADDRVRPVSRHEDARNGELVVP